MSRYYEWNEFKGIYLEDSFVLEIKESEEEVSFAVEMVLTKEHPMYSKPKRKEQYCYRRAKIIFKGLKKVKWLKKNIKPFTDADGSEDFGNIDSFELLSGGYHLRGDWGEVIIFSDPPSLEWIK